MPCPRVSIAIDVSDFRRGKDTHAPLHAHSQYLAFALRLRSMTKASKRLKNKSSAGTTSTEPQNQKNGTKPTSSSTKHGSRSPRQLHLLKPEPRFFGGRLLYKRRKGRRPLSSKEAMHIVMRSLWAKGPFSFRAAANHSAIEQLIKSVSQRYGVRVYRKTIMSNHIHLVLLAGHRESYKAFIRLLTGQIASHVMMGLSFVEFIHQFKDQYTESTTNGSITEPQGVGQKFFQFRPFTRVLHWGRDFKTCCDYVLKNTLEALGFIPYQPREDSYAKWIRETMDDLKAMA